jgi:TetR/AcrR family transcriptional regulator, fatty acid biosynthesis regulator
MPIRDERRQQTHQALINAVLSLSQQGRTFSSMSLREITGEVHLAPATFYRHFQNMDQLGLELIDHLGIYLKSGFSQMYKMAIQHPHEHEKRLNFLLNMVDQRPDYWSFFIHERSSGSAVIRKALQREVAFLVEYTTTTMQQIEDFCAIQDDDSLETFAEMFVHMSFCWALQWLDLRYEDDLNKREHDQKKLKAKALLQLKLLYSGMQTWA